MPQRREGSRCARARAEDRNMCSEKGLCSLGVPLEVWVRNDASTFNTSDFASFVFLFREGVGDQAAVRTGVRRALSGSLRCLSSFFEVHDAPPWGTGAFQYVRVSMNLLNPQNKIENIGRCAVRLLRQSGGMYGSR